MNAREVRLELAVGRRVRAKNGRPVGRLEEVVADEHWRVREYHIGPGAVRRRGYRARWDQLDLSDPRQPRLTCALEEIARLEAG